jgi:hypothetical protein
VLFERRFWHMLSLFGSMESAYVLALLVSSIVFTASRFYKFYNRREIVRLAERSRVEIARIEEEKAVKIALIESAKTLETLQIIKNSEKEIEKIRAKKITFQLNSLEIPRQCEIGEAESEEILELFAAEFIRQASNRPSKRIDKAA